MRLAPEEVRMLAQQQRDMDTGKVFFVVLNGERLAVEDDVAKELGLERGQTISRDIFGAILNARIAHVQAKIALDKSLAR